MIQLNQNVAKEAVENILNQLEELNIQVGYAVNIYPFKIVSGLTRFTETGEKKLNFNSKDFRNCVDIINSNEPIVCYWEGSYQSITTDQSRDYQTKIFTASGGVKIKSWIINYSKSVELNNISLGAPGKESAYQYVAQNRNIQVFTREWEPTDDDLRNYFYIIVDKKANSPQLLRAVDSTPIYKPNGEYLGSNITFTNINLAYAQSGKDILNFPKMCHPGGNYAFPKEIDTKNGIETVLDTDIINNIGVNDIQVYFEGAYCLNSLVVVGRPASVNKLYAPRRLLLLNPHPPISSSLDLVGTNTNEYYACFSAKPVFQALWDNWKQQVVALYNNTAKKTYQGGVQVNYAETEATNPLASGLRTFNLWNNWIFKPTENREYDTTEVFDCANSITFDTQTNYSVCDFLNHNNFIYSTYEQLPIEYSEFTKWTLGDLGKIGQILQGFLNVITLNFIPPVGWLNANTWLPRKPINCLIPISVYELGKLICADTQLQPIPYDVFTNSEDFSGAGNQHINCGFRAELTDLFVSPSQVNISASATIGTGKDGIWNTMYLGQHQFKDGTTFKSVTNNQVDMLQWKSDCRAVKNSNLMVDGYEVDFVQYQGIGKANCRLSFNKYIEADFTNCQSVWEARQQTNARFKDDIKLWRNQMKLNFSEEFNNSGTMEYPRVINKGEVNPDVAIVYNLFQTDQEVNLTQSGEDTITNGNFNLDGFALTIICDGQDKIPTTNIQSITGMSMQDLVNTYDNVEVKFDLVLKADPSVPNSTFDTTIPFSFNINNNFINNGYKLFSKWYSEITDFFKDAYPLAGVDLTRVGQDVTSDFYLTMSQTPLNIKLVENQCSASPINVTIEKENEDLLFYCNQKTGGGWIELVSIPAATRIPATSGQGSLDITGEKIITEWFNETQAGNYGNSPIRCIWPSFGAIYDPNSHIEFEFSSGYKINIPMKPDMFSNYDYTTLPDGEHSVIDEAKTEDVATNRRVKLILEMKTENGERYSRFKIKWEFHTPNIFEPKEEWSQLNTKIELTKGNNISEANIRRYELSYELSYGESVYKKIYIPKIKYVIKNAIIKLSNNS